MKKALWVLVVLLVGFVLGIVVTREVFYVSAQPPPREFSEKLKRFIPWVDSSTLVTSQYFYEFTSNQKDEVNVLIEPNHKKKGVNVTGFPMLWYTASKDGSHERWVIADNQNNNLFIKSEDGKFAELSIFNFENGKQMMRIDKGFTGHYCITNEVPQLPTTNQVNPSQK